MLDAHEKDIAVPGSHAVDTQWLHRVVDALQAAVRDALMFPPEIACGALRAVGERVPAPRNALERFALRGLLFEYACRAGVVLHKGLHVGRPSHCHFDSVVVACHCFAVTTTDPRSAFGKWTTDFSSELRRGHPESAVEKVARHIQEHYQEPFDAEELASGVGLTSSGLRRAFRNAFGQSMREYQSAVRLLRALELVRAQKVIVAARVLGYQSTKNFYRMFRKVTGLTPTEYRSLPASEADEAAHNGWARLGRGPIAGCSRSSIARHARASARGA